MSEEQPVTVQQETRPRGMPGLTWAVILIAVGVVFLINNLHLNGFSIDWLALIRYWPVILILVGLELILGRRSVFGSLAVAALALVTIGGLVWLVGQTASSPAFSPTTTREVSQELGDVQSAKVDFNLGAGDTHIASTSDAVHLISGTYTTNRDLQLAVDYQKNGGQGVLRIRQDDPSNKVDPFGNFIGKLDLKLTDAVPLDITVDAGVGNITLDLSGVQLSSLTIKGGVGNVSVTLPAQGSYAVSADMGIGELRVTMPKSLEAHLSVDSGIGNSSIPPRFKPSGNSQWKTGGYDGSSNRADLTVKSGIGNFELIDQ